MDLLHFFRTIQTSLFRPMAQVDSRNALPPVSGDLDAAPQASLTAPAWITTARRYLGTQEIPGPRTQALILKWWGLIRAAYKDDETPWCAAFVGGVLEECGIRSTRSASSLSYLKWGIPLTKPRFGAVAVKRRKGGGHVTFVAGTDGKGGLWCLGGNQGDAVTLALYPAAVFEDFRWPEGVPVNLDPLPILAAGKASIPKEA